MFESIKQILGGSSASEGDFAGLKARGALILDVRTGGEFRDGHIEGAKNIPLQVLETECGTLRKDVPVITCCASGMRSAAAKRILDAKGFSEVVNGGGWAALQRKLAG